MPMLTTALRDPANETPLADSPGIAGCETLVVARGRARAESQSDAVTGLGDHMGWRAS